jgi:hypothetical protein
MFVVEADTTRQLLVLSVAGVVTADESRETVGRVREKLEQMVPGFVALVDCAGSNRWRPERRHL